MKLAIASDLVRFSQIVVGHCFKTNDGTIMMRIRKRCGDKSHAINLACGEEIYFANTSCQVTPLNLKVVLDD